MKNKHRYLHQTLLTILMLLTAGIHPAIAAPFYEIESATVRIAPTGADVSGCGSTSQPCKTIQYAVNQAVSGDIIKVASGAYTYNPENNGCTSLNTPAVVCIYNKNLAISGGYSSTDWENYNPSQNLTVIDGQGQYRGVAVIASSDNQAVVTFKGFTVQNGRAYGKNSGVDYVRHAFGAGIYASHGLMTLEDLVVKNNTAYGGTNTSISGGGWAFGGGISIEGPVYGTGKTTLKNVTMENNQAAGGNGKDAGGVAIGGGFFATTAAVAAANLTITNNSAIGGNSDGKGIASNGMPADALGGGIGLQSNNDLNFSHVTASGNQARGGAAGTIPGSAGGSGIGGAIFVEQTTFSLTDSVLKNNSVTGGLGMDGGVGFGGALLTDSTYLTADRVKFIANSVTSGASRGSGQAGAAGGGGAYLAYFDTKADFPATLRNCLFAENQAAIGYPGGTTKGGGGGGIFIQALPADIIHSTFSNNSLGNGLAAGQAIIVSGTYGSTSKHGVANLYYDVFTDHITTSNHSTVTTQPESTANFHYVWFGNNTRTTNEDWRPIPPGIFTYDHVWKETRSAEYKSPGLPNYDYNLQANSPVIDLGYNSTTKIDLESKPRPIGAAEDLGAFEFSIPSLVVDLTSASVLTDANQIISRIFQISVSGSTPVNWNAQTGANWIYLGASGTSQQASGTTKADLIVRIDPSKVNYGTYSATISITSPTTEPTTISIYLIKAETLQEVYIPVILRQ